jgi:hypothetical protein
MNCCRNKFFLTQGKKEFASELKKKKHISEALKGIIRELKFF